MRNKIQTVLPFPFIYFTYSFAYYYPVYTLLKSKGYHLLYVVIKITIKKMGCILQD